jgi:hypothetical protein
MSKIKLRGSNNVMLTQALFSEFDKDAPYTLKHESHGNFKSVYEIYMESTDEYEAAIKIVNNMVHWEKLCGLDWFMNGIPEKNIRGLKDWREDMKHRDASLAKRQLIEQTKTGNTTAARALYDMATKGSKGRPEKKTTKQDKSSVTELFKGAKR